MRKATPLLLLLLFAATFVGCDVIGSDDPVTLDGQYEITTQFDGASITLDLNLSESDNGLSGSGTAIVEDPNSSSAATLDLDLSGSHNHPDVELNMSLEDGGDLTFDGTVEDGGSRAEGTLTFPSGDQNDVTMRKQ